MRTSSPEPAPEATGQPPKGTRRKLSWLRSLGACGRMTSSWRKGNGKSIVEILSEIYN